MTTSTFPSNDDLAVATPDPTATSGGGHGFAGSHMQPFTELLPAKRATFDAHHLAELAQLMKGDFDTVKDGADP